jgi:hypothetical protein
LEDLGDLGFVFFIAEVDLARVHFEDHTPFSLVFVFWHEMQVQMAGSLVTVGAIIDFIRAESGFDRLGGFGNVGKVGSAVIVGQIENFFGMTFECDNATARVGLLFEEEKFRNGKVGYLEHQRSLALVGITVHAVFVLFHSRSFIDLVITAIIRHLQAVVAALYGPIGDESSDDETITVLM